MHFLHQNASPKFSVVTLVAAAQVAQLPVLLLLAASLSFKFILYHFQCFCMLLCFSISYNFRQCYMFSVLLALFEYSTDRSQLVVQVK